MESVYFLLYFYGFMRVMHLTDMEAEDLNILHGISKKNLSYLAEDAKDFAVYKGIAMWSPDLPKDFRVPLPFCITPSQFPRKWFDYVYSLQPYMNLILFKIANSKQILKECLASTIEVDEFTRNIFKIYEAQEDSANQQISLGLIRSDYLLDCNCDGKIIGIKQVENNTIASGLGGVSPQVRDLHKYILEKFGHKDLELKLPVNKSVYEMAKGIVSAWHIYGNNDAIVLFVVEKATFNICDQRALEFLAIKLQSKIKILRCTFKDLRTAALTKNGKLFVKEKEVAVVYYRVGYKPEHYEAEDWNIRLLMELSSAIKCPSAGLHLAGTKRVQLYLNRPGVLEDFVNSGIAAKLREVFGCLYSLNMSEGGDEVISQAIQQPQKYVIKPEREGGGNNLYGIQIRNFLENIKTTERRKAYILMERINPPSLPNCIVRTNEIPKMTSVNCELGIFGTILGSKDHIYFNNAAGHLLRSKESQLNEGGVASGIGALDSPYLY